MRNKKGVLSRFRNYLYDSSVSIRNRTFVLFSVCELAAVFLYSFTGMLLRDTSIGLIISLAGTFAVLVLLYILVKMDRIKTAKVLLPLILVLVLRPAALFSNGGINNGALLMSLAGSYYLFLVLEGWFRVLMIFTDTAIIFICGVMTFRHPWLLPEYSRKNDYIYSFLQYIIAFSVFIIMAVFWRRTLLKESKNAEEKSKQLEELNRAQNRFFSSMSHEIRTPINTVLGMNELILRQEDATEEIRKDAENIRGAGKLLLSLINDILDISKIEAGRMDIIPVDYNVGELLSEVVNMIWLKAEEKGLKLDVDIDPEIPTVLFGDEVRIRQILLNLLNNAVKYTKEGSVGLYVECGFLEDESVLLTISVSDTGIGIRPEAMPDLFETFKRADEEKNRKIEGTGLGLSIVRQLLDLMDGEITVNSVYSEGSVFTVKLKQGISSEKRIGDLKITGTGAASRTERFEHSFYAPDCRILIVDDNEMNLQVEEKLLAGTGMTVDTALSGKEALVLTLKNRYDVIFMDHLMPQMDGIECFEKIRTQRNGLNLTSPVIVLTANAAGENTEIYNNAGFDGYLLKPVSGRRLEDVLLLHLPQAKVQISEKLKAAGYSVSTASRYEKKKAVAIAAVSMTDLPKAVADRLQINIIPGKVITDEGVFLDNVDIDSDELLSYMYPDNKNIAAKVPSHEEYLSFFSSLLKKAHHVIYVALSSSISADYERSVHVAETFENVTVVNSECFSSAAGILVLLAAKLAKQNYPAEKIVSELEEAKKMIRCSFMIKMTEVMAEHRQMSSVMNNIMRTVWARPVLRMKNDRPRFGGLFFGDDRKCYDEYIRSVISKKKNIDRSFIFVTYSGIDDEDLLWIEQKLAASLRFDRIIFQKVSACVASNFGKGVIGLLYMANDKNNYNIGSIFDNISDEADEPHEDPDTGQREKKWYEDIPGIDAKAALKNSGSEESLQTVTKLFYETYGARSGELQEYFDNKDWENYTIKVHALKSSSRLVGATKLSAEAEALEMAGQRSDTGFIMENHDSLMETYASIIKAFSEQYGQTEDLPPVPEEMLKDAYESLSEFVSAKDFDLVRMVLGSVKEYSLPPEDDDRIKRLSNCLSAMDWEGMKDILGEER